MTETTTGEVAGEPVAALLAALAFIGAQSKFDKHGGMRVSALLTPDVALPFRRALMRVESELLLADADQLGEGSTDDRTSEQRCHDAFIALILRVVAAAPPDRVRLLAEVWPRPQPTTKR